MAKLEDLRKLVDAARANATRVNSPKRSVERSPKPTPALKSTRRVLAAQRHADGDIDLAQAFADVERLRPHSRIAHTPPRPKPIPAQRIADDADALSASKYGAEPTPNTWEIGQELEAGQTFVRRGLGRLIRLSLLFYQPPNEPYAAEGDQSRYPRSDQGSRCCMVAAALVIPTLVLGEYGERV